MTKSFEPGDQVVVLTPNPVWGYISAVWAWGFYSVILKDEVTGKSRYAFICSERDVEVAKHHAQEIYPFSKVVHAAEWDLIQATKGVS